MIPLAQLGRLHGLGSLVAAAQSVASSILHVG